MNIFRNILSNFLTFLLSLLLAILIWLNASQSNAPPRLHSYQIPIDFIGQPENSTLTTSDENVVIIVEARLSILDQLTAASFTAVADLSQLDLGEDVVADVDVQPKLRGVTITSSSPNDVTVRLEQLVTREVPVVLDIRGSVARGHTQGDPLLVPEVITVVGTEAQVNRLDSARVTVFLDNASETAVSTPVPIFYDRQGRVASTSGLKSVSHEEVQVTIPVTESAASADNFIEVNGRGAPAEGYRLLGITVSPPSVLVQGVPTRLNEITQIRTEPIDITGLTETFTQTVTLELPEDITLDEVQVVSVSVEIEPILTTGVYNRPVEVLGLGRNLTSTVQPTEVRIVLFGPLPVLDSLAEDEVRVTVDAFGLITGTYNLEPDIDLPDRGIELRSVQPSLVAVTITSTLTDTLSGFVRPSQTSRLPGRLHEAKQTETNLSWPTVALRHVSLLPEEKIVCLLNP